MFIVGASPMNARRGTRRIVDSPATLIGQDSRVVKVSSRPLDLARRSLFDPRSTLSRTFIDSRSEIEDIESSRDHLTPSSASSRLGEEKRDRLTSHDELDHGVQRVAVVHDALVRATVGRRDGVQVQRVIFQRQGHSVAKVPDDGRAAALVLEQPHPVRPPLQHQHQRVLRHPRAPQRHGLTRFHDHFLHQRVHGICEQETVVVSVPSRRARVRRGIDFAMDGREGGAIDWGFSFGVIERISSEWNPVGVGGAFVDFTTRASPRQPSLKGRTGL